MRGDLGVSAVGTGVVVEGDYRVNDGGGDFGVHCDGGIVALNGSADGGGDFGEN